MRLKLQQIVKRIKTNPKILRNRTPEIQQIQNLEIQFKILKQSMTNTNQELLGTSRWHIWHGSHVLSDPGNKSSLQTYVATLTLQILYFIFNNKNYRIFVTMFSSKLLCTIAQFLSSWSNTWNWVWNFDFWNLGNEHWQIQIWQQCLEFFLLSSISIWTCQEPELSQFFSTHER